MHGLFMGHSLAFLKRPVKDIHFKFLCTESAPALGTPHPWTIYVPTGRTLSPVANKYDWNSKRLKGEKSEYSSYTWFGTQLKRKYDNSGTFPSLWLCCLSMLWSSGGVLATHATFFILEGERKEWR